jgi:hypothetical protein
LLKVERNNLHPSKRFRNRTKIDNKANVVARGTLLML